MDLSCTFGTDKKLESEGFKYELDKDSWIQLAYAGATNSKYQRLLQEYIKKHRAKLKRGTMSSDEDRKLLVDVYAQVIVKDWHNIYIKEEQIPYSVDNARRIFTDFPSLFEEISQEAQNIENFRNTSSNDDIDETVEDAKKS